MSSDIHQEGQNFTPKCVGSTRDTFNHVTKSGRSNFFRNAAFSGDGTTIVTQNEDQCLKTFVLPTDLLDDRDEPTQLIPYATYQSGSNIQSYALYPHFSLHNPATTLVLSGSADVPITLRNALHYDTIHGTYPFVTPTTEEHLPPRSLAFTRDGRRFIAGSVNVLATFDCTRTGEGPLSTQKLRPGKGQVQHFSTWQLQRKGIVSAMSISSEGMLAIGTNEREIALFEDDGLGECSTVFELEGRGGSGITGLKWSPDGQYLLVAERQSDVVQVFDIRNTQSRVASLAGRRANTPQVLGIDVVPTAAGFEVWGGGTDGIVRMWSNPGSKGGAQSPDTEMKMHDTAVSSAVWHPSGVVMATCSGERPSTIADGSDEEPDLCEDSIDNTLRLWTV
ncbi:Guanine nucleotide-binding protein negative regulator 1 [Fulvia fulva]|uniref:Guanine nucleotide-binding protein negative regulator 1 n=1 Tax=Passalora fulva TaxID=5499 RepID=A0A9Q8USM3_PASFU|nr:Guanine nucleotide-binding protein negative regulator 1 [Fulvia fulva]KAK4618323.1 Guanine nucleotide-binding protein negative regulator 1 [Fulvia fulva]KAK4618819.1 Guanine nucleotide-binding protein negative regulator 1 [Fulvia fulva]UJO20920.1 Guanine nucleotide-binding protein negative regulator 1 [Fulvia fulva]WPV18641.1 Guanine nucleotide-binding protein negative regulator 1 [Fulvia fulva]WPV33241.1 Guanine nucleotide-binding protein negative regulator 1 [Fulvia fulva]